jgi:hypothetical protein
MSARLQVVIHRLILKEMCNISMGQNINSYIVMMIDAKGGNKKKRVDYIKLF